ncbi:MAG: glycosyltransferase family 4 protein [Acidimicrobiales bacterium]
MKVALTHPYSWPEVRRGTERIVVETARALARRGHAVTIFTSGQEAGSTWEGGVRTLRFRRRFTAPLRHESWFAARIAPPLAWGRFDVVHSMMPLDALSAILVGKITGHRTVYEEMGLPSAAWWAGLRDGRVRRLVVRLVDVYGCMSNYALGILRSDWGREGHLIPGGVALDRFQPSTHRADVPTVLFSGALTEARKGLALLLEAVARVATDVPDVELWLSGPGDPSSILEAAPAAARQRTVVLPLGEPRDQADRYARAWVTALPSRNDSFGLVLIESLAAGTPIVVLDDAAPPELVRDGNGVVAETADAAGLAAALYRSLELARLPQTSARCRESSRRYDWDDGLAPLLEELYRPDHPRLSTQSNSVR